MAITAHELAKHLGGEVIGARTVIAATGDGGCVYVGLFPDAPHGFLVRLVDTRMDRAGAQRLIRAAIERWRSGERSQLELWGTAA
jgi:hypothetical protein